MRQLVVHEILRDAAHQHATKYVISGLHQYSYQNLWERTVRLAQSLSRKGVGRGTVVGVMDVNSHRYLELTYALSLLGAVIHTINFRLPPNVLYQTINQVHDEWLFLWDGFGPLSESTARHAPHVVWMYTRDPEHDEYESLIAQGSLDLPDVSAMVQPDDVYSLFYTTGTTGNPKGIHYTHRQMLTGALQIAHHLGLYGTGAPLHHDDILMPLIPFFHIHGWGVPFIAPYLGASLVLSEDSNPAQQRQLISRHQVTWSNMVPTQLAMLLEQEEASLPLKVLTGGSAVPMGLAHKAWERGVSFSVIYGGSDQLGSAISSYEGANGSPQSLARALTPFPMVRIEIRNDDGQLVPSDGTSVGEVWVQSPWLPQGYVNNREASAQSYRDGWFRSGDLAQRNPLGQIFVVDRIKDAVKSGGEWILTTSIESILSEIPGVRKAAVIAVSNDRWGERPYAVIESDPELEVASIHQSLARAVSEGRLAKFWVPDRIILVESLPMTSAGKIDKATLRKKLFTP